MNFELTNDDVKEMVKKAATIQIEERIVDIVYDLLNDDELKNIIKEVMIEFIKSEEGREFIKKSFTDYYFKDNNWIESESITESIDEEIIIVIKKLFKNINYNFD